MEILGFSMVISVISEVISVISVDFGDFGESCYPSKTAHPLLNRLRQTTRPFVS